MAKKFYAIKEGIKTGIFTSWDEASKYVTSVTGAVYKGFNNLSDAKAYLADNESESVETTGENTLTAYVDGSFGSGDNFGCGVVLIKDGKVIHTISEKRVDPELAKMNNVAGEITAARIAMEYALKGGYTAITIYHDYKGVADWCTGEWKATKPGTKAYRDFYNNVTKKIDVKFVKVAGHSGNKYNDLADELAKDAIGLN
jgi:ribonuclease H